MKQRPTWSDGCTAFPEGPWSPCCWAHDKAYREGGRTVWARLLADVKLAHCAAMKGYHQVAILLFLGVRIGGWWPWLTYRLHARARRKMETEAIRLRGRRAVVRHLRLRQLQRRRKEQS